MKNFLIPLFAVAFDGELALHRQLFNPEIYNPKVLIDNWRKMNRNDYENLGSFVVDKCLSYKPTFEAADIGSVVAIERF